MQRELAEFTSAELTVGLQATNGGQASSTTAKGLTRLRSVGATVGAFLPTRRPGAHGAAADAGPQVVTKAAFERWFRNRCKTAVDDPYDVLYGTTDSRAYYWFMQILWLKTLINLLYSFGRAAQPGDALHSWHLWVAMLLSASVCAMICVNPYLSPIDQTVELFALLCLARGGACTRAAVRLRLESLVH